MKFRVSPFRRIGAASSVLVVLVFGSWAYAQGRVSVGDYYGGGPNGTIGRGSSRQERGPSDWGGGAPGSPPAYGYGGFLGRGRFTTRSYSSNYAPPASPRTPAAESPAAAGPYLTTQFYEPGDGYRYALYYNPATRSYFYYPVRTR